MGQKVSPIGMRVGVIRDWESRWYAGKADFGDLLNEDVKIRKFLEKELKDAYISRIEIERTGKKDCKIVIRCARPGAMLGKDGDKDKMQILKAKLAKLTDGKNIKVDVVAVANPDLDARLVARKICEQLEARQSFRIAQKKAIQQTMRSGAKGIKTLAKGRLGGAATTYGKLGVKVWICRGEVLPGQMVKEPEAPARPARGDRRNRRGGRNDRRSNNRNDRRPAQNNASAQAAPAEQASEGGNN